MLRAHLGAAEEAFEPREEPPDIGHSLVALVAAVELKEGEHERQRVCGRGPRRIIDRRQESGWMGRLYCSLTCGDIERSHATRCLQGGGFSVSDRFQRRRGSGHQKSSKRVEPCR
jgi:hypothetical protein